MVSVETVLGPVQPNDLGTTLMHEHIWLDIAFRFRGTKLQEKKNVADTPVTMENLGLLRRSPHLCKDNLRLDNEFEMAEELRHFRSSGGRTIVELTPDGIGRNPVVLRRIALMSGVNVLVSTGWYKQATHPTFVKKCTVEQLAEIMVSELNEGIGNTGIRAAVIGECAASHPLPYHPDEKKVLRAACRAQRTTGAAFTIHQDYGRGSIKTRDGKVAQKVYEHYSELIEREGADISKFYLSHCDGTLFDIDYQARIMDMGMNLEYDTFGMEYRYDYALTGEEAESRTLSGATIWERMPIGTRDPTDEERVRAVVELCKRGYEKQLTLSHDVCHKTELKKYGGQGYSHILETIVPWLRQEGVGQKQIRTMLVENPRRILAR